MHFYNFLLAFVILFAAADTKQELLSDVGVLNATMQQIKSQSANNLNQLNSGECERVH